MHSYLDDSIEKMPIYIYIYAYNRRIQKRLSIDRSFS